MVGIFAHDGGAFKPAASIPIKNGSVWQNTQEVWANNNGVWMKVFPSLVREPASGEYFQAQVYQWNIVPQIGVATIWWPNSSAQGQTFPTSNTTYVSGSWTYYRGTSKGSNLYGIYRIGTP